MRNTWTENQILPWEKKENTTKLKTSAHNVEINVRSYVTKT